MDRFFTRHSLKVLMVLAALMPPLVLLSRQLEQNNAVENWLPQSSPKLQALKTFRQHFGAEEFVLISWEGSSLDDPRAPFLARQLSAMEEIQRVETPQRLLDVMTRPPLSLSREEAERRLQGILLGRPDPQTQKRPLALAAVLSEKGAHDRPGMVARIQEIARQAVDLKPHELYLAGPPVVNAALDTWGKGSIGQLLKYLVGVCVALSFVLLRDWRLAILVLLTAGYSVIASQALVYGTGGSLNLVMVVMTPLVLVIGLSGAVHMANYWREAAREAPVEVVTRAWQMGWKPCLFASLTTVIGLLSLGTSHITPVQQFGLYSAAGSLIVLVMVLLALPAGLQLFAVPRSSRLHEGGDGWQRLAGTLGRHRKLVMFLSLLLFAAAAAGLPRLRTTVKAVDYFPEDSNVVRSYRFLEQHVAYVVPVETVIRFKDARLSFAERIELVREIEQKIRALPEVGGTLSLADFVPATPHLRVPALKTAYEAAARSLTRRQDAAASLLTTTPEGEELWRISARVPALSDLDYGQFLDKLAQPVLATIREHGAPPGVYAEFTGLVPVVYEAQQQVLRSLILTFSLAFIDILIVIIPWLRSLSISLVAMIPNLTPVLLVFGGLSWAGVDIDIASMMTASVALGIAVDGTLHFLTWFRDGLYQGLPRPQAIAVAMRHCGPSLVQTALLAGIGLSVLGFSRFEPVSRFGWLLGLVLGAGLLGDLLLLPAMLSGAPGRLIERAVLRRRPRAATPLVGPHRRARATLQRKTN